MFDDELDVFFDEDDFAVACTRSRPGEDDVTFAGILSSQDDDGFEGQVVVTQHRLHYATAAADLQPGDVLRTVRRSASGVDAEPVVWRVIRSPDRLVDGAESLVFIKPDPEA